MCRRVPRLNAFLFVATISCFLFGFFPWNSILSKEATTEHLQWKVPDGCRNLQRESVQKLVFIVIDAWRLDFFSQYEEMPFSRSEYEAGRAEAFEVVVNAPTVTMPRIKALTSGTVPSFSSLLLNFGGSSESSDDHWLRGARDKGKRIVFYGDDTWISLFGSYFERSEGVVSFFVKDFTEVDSNVTRHISKEFSPERISTWDILILHYLGLDHIGHSLGGDAQEINAKLREMDAVVREINEKLQKEDSFSLIVVGDHGMTLSGGHGGSSPLETRVPLLHFSNDGKLLSPRVRQNYDFESIDQSDIASFISSLLGISSPKSAVGINFQAFSERGIDPGHFGDLLSIASDAKRLLGLLRSNSILTDSLKMCIEQVGRIVGNCSRKTFRTVDLTFCNEALRKARTQLIRQSSTLDIGPLAVAILIASLNVAAMIWGPFSIGFTKNESKHFSAIFFAVALCTHFGSFFASSLVEEEHDIWYFLFASAIFVEIVMAIRTEILRTQNCSLLSLLRLLLVLFVHRACSAFASGSRRRNTMPEGTFPDPIVHDPESVRAALAMVEWTGFIVPLSCVFTVGYKFRECTDRRTLSRDLLPLGLAFTVYIIGNGSLKNNMVLVWTCSSILLISGRMEGLFLWVGNSNSISTIDISSGYTGLSNYQPLLVALQIMLNSYSAPIALLSGYRVSSHAKIEWMSMCMARGVSLLGVLLSLLVFHEHLFVWSVFAPRTLVELSHCTVFLISCLLSSWIH